MYTVNEFNRFVDKLNFDEILDMINFRLNVRLMCMLSIIPCKKYCIIKSMSSIIY